LNAVDPVYHREFFRFMSIPGTDIEEWLNLYRPGWIEEYVYGMREKRPDLYAQVQDWIRDHYPQ
jgi:hypothetical protein